MISQDKTFDTVHVVGAGLAGSECAYQLAERGYNVIIYEMRPQVMTPAHKSPHCAELVCSNSFGSESESSPSGQLKWEAGQLRSLILEKAKAAQVPAGQALGMDREVFARSVDEVLRNHPRIQFKSEVVTSLDQVPRPCVVATGPLTGEALAQSMLDHFGDKFLYFFDAIAPIVSEDSIDMSIAWKASRWGNGTDDYINCPLNKEQYERFIDEIERAEKVEPKEFEKNTPYFDGCMPIEAMVERGRETPRFGPMKPSGLDDPKTGRWPHAVVQLRQDNKEGTAFNIVGFQTKMKYPEQKRIFRMIPGLENAEFLKLGSIHRNMYINSPRRLSPDLSSRKDPLLFFAGQITGVEGYFESACIGLLVAGFLDQKIKDETFNPPPRETAMGALLAAITLEDKDNFQPTNINFGLFPPLSISKKLPKDEKKRRIIERARQTFSAWAFDSKKPDQCRAHLGLSESVSN
ncbi:MAG: methylenetetrahydrofolate--tRNA-(uracil(54)-C(5))-methyltransferase (FADH(2)-oxidizing) TrmFO [Bdellovibrionales bacterium]|nr:methylenetetrahydrofolate--tRNA-(uracil(54)-C(5))-methyltransferase (FADH(2)-oxidizing) TrmFO [Bdellovibrionales bacterium]